jgi:hypothetical protein
MKNSALKLFWQTQAWLYIPVVGFELRASHLLSRHSTTWATPPALLCIECFQDRLLQSICPRLALILLITASWAARTTGARTGTQLLWTFCLGWPWTVILLIVSQVSRMTGVSHYAWPDCEFEANKTLSQTNKKNKFLKKWLKPRRVSSWVF